LLPASFLLLVSNVHPRSPHVSPVDLAVVACGQLFSDPLVVRWLNRERGQSRDVAIPLFIFSPGFTSAISFSPCSRPTEMRSFSPVHKFIFWWSRW
jgi:hypothetical protein